MNKEILILIRSVFLGFIFVYLRSDPFGGRRSPSSQCAPSEKSVMQGSVSTSMQRSISNHRDLVVPKPSARQLPNVLGIHMRDFGSKFCPVQNPPEISSLFGIFQAGTGGTVCVQQLIPVLGSGSVNLCLLSLNSSNGTLAASSVMTAWPNNKS